MAGTPPNIDVHWPAILLARPGQFQHHPSPSAFVSTMPPPSPTTNMAQIAGAGTITTTLSSAGAYDDTSDELSTQTPDMIEEKRPAFSVSIETIVVSALIFIAILAWFEF